MQRFLNAPVYFATSVSYAHKIFMKKTFVQAVWSNQHVQLIRCLRNLTGYTQTGSQGSQFFYGRNLQMLS
jgi:hypothetical protein